MRLFPAFLFVGLALLKVIRAHASTDYIQDVDPEQSGYLPNHNLDPVVVASSAFGITWSQTFNKNELFFAKPLVYTPSGYDRELVILSSNQNTIRIIDGQNGTLLNSRTVKPPFQASDVQCTNIQSTIGIIGTPVIDPETDIMYFMEKGYEGGIVGPTGDPSQGEYSMYAVYLPSLEDAPGFPVPFNGHNAINDPTRYFVGGTVLQRPSLAMVGNSVLAAFGGHCDMWNYTGILASVTKTTQQVTMYAMEASPGAPTPQALNVTDPNANGGKAGIWHSGMGLATDGSDRVFLITGNGKGAANGGQNDVPGVPASGRDLLTTLDCAAVNFAIDASTGAISQTDYFEPYEYNSLDGADSDFGSSGASLLDPAVFSGGDVERVLVGGGKNGKIYIMNADNMGGFAQGAGGSDNVIQTISIGKQLYSGVGSYPLEGGYIYFNPSADYLYCYAMGHDSTGRPLFTLVGQTATTYAGQSAPTITSLNGENGTGIVWLSDANKGLVAFKAVPVNGVLQPITIPSSGGLTKFTRPGFGDGRVYVAGSNTVYGFGTPVNLALSCNPVSFGTVDIGESSSAQITCKANTAVTINGCTTSRGTFQCSNSSLPSSVAAGATFTFPVTWNLTLASIENAQQANPNYTVLPGTETVALHIYNTATGYSPLTPVKLMGVVEATEGYLVTSSIHVDFQGLVLGNQDSSTLPFTLTNTGKGPLTFTGFAWEDLYDEDTSLTNVSVKASGQPTVIGTAFTSTSFPSVDSQLAPNTSIDVPVTFSTNKTGTWSSLLTVWSDGGVVRVQFAGTAAAAAVATLSISDADGNWVSSLEMDFGKVAHDTTTERQIRLCNSGESTLTITQSTPPNHQYLTVLDTKLDLPQGATVAAGNCSYGTVALIASNLQPNHPNIPVSGTWIIQTNGNMPDGTAWTPQTISITGQILSRQVGPLQSNGQGVYQITGCYNEGQGRNLVKSTSFDNNTIEACMNYCYGLNYAYAGTEYHTECWCGSSIKYPNSLGVEADCNYHCPGDISERCGGQGNANGNAYIYIYQNVLTVPVSSTSTSNTQSSTTHISSLTTLPTSSRFSTSTQVSSSLSGSATASFTTSSTKLSSSASSTVSSSTETSILTTSSTASSATPSQTLNPNEPAIVGTWDYIGCYQDLVNGVRTFSAATYAYDGMTLESCAQNCTGYDYFGTSYGRECYCGWTLSSSLKADESDCNTVCSGDSSEICGTGSRLSVYKNTIYTAPPSPPQHVPSTSGFNWLGCYTEATTGRALGAASQADDSMTVESCVAFCAGYVYAGIEYSRECYCGNAIAIGSVLSTTDSCSMLCKGNSSEYCGGSGSCTIAREQHIIVRCELLGEYSRIINHPTVRQYQFRGGFVIQLDNFPELLQCLDGGSFINIIDFEILIHCIIIYQHISISFKQLTTYEQHIVPDNQFLIDHPDVFQLFNKLISKLLTKFVGEFKCKDGLIIHLLILRPRKYIRGANLVLLFLQNNGHALPLLFANDSVTPELCEAYVLSLAAAPTPTVLPVFYVEYHRECYGGTSLSFGTSGVTSLTGKHACTDVCSGSKGATTTGTAMCGGPGQFDLYVTGTTMSWGQAVQTKSV